MRHAFPGVKSQSEVHIRLPQKRRPQWPAGRVPDAQLATLDIYYSLKIAAWRLTSQIVHEGQFAVLPSVQNGGGVTPVG